MEELREILKCMDRKSIRIKIRGVIELDFTMHRIKCYYNQNRGMLHIKDKDKNKRIAINTYMAYILKANENKKIIEIKLDNEQDVTIKIM